MEVMDPELDVPICATCGNEMEWERCDYCGGDGFVWHDGDAEEPWDGYETCEACAGEGGEWFCCPPA